MSRWIATLQAASLDEVARWNILNSNLFSYPNRPPAFPGQPTHGVQPLDLYADYDTCMDNVVYWGDGGGMDDFSRSDSVPCTEYNSEWLQGTATVWSQLGMPGGFATIVDGAVSIMNAVSPVDGCFEDVGVSQETDEFILSTADTFMSTAGVLTYLCEWGPSPPTEAVCAARQAMAAFGGLLYWFGKTVHVTN